MTRRILLLTLTALALRAQDIGAKVEEYIKGYTDQNKFMGSVLIAKGGKILVDKGYGMANLELDVPSGPQTKFRLGSITKQFTAAAILQLEEKGKLNVQDPISKYFTESPEAWKEITIHHLLTHTAGVPNYTSFPEFVTNARKPVTVAELIETFKNKPLDFAPGTKYSYSNSGYELLGYVIEKVSGISYEEYLKKNIFSRLDMSSSGYDHDTTVIKNRASGYTASDGNFQNARYLDMSIPYAAGSLYSTVDDLYRWDRALYTDKVLGAKAKAEMYTPGKNNYAYGWTVQTKPRLVYSHGGGIFGFATFIARYPDDDACIVVLSNIEGGPSGRIAGDLAKILFGEKYEIPRKRVAITVDPKLFERYAGTYQAGPMTFVVSMVGDKLMAGPQGQPPVQLFAESETDFFLKVVDAQMTFGKIEGGKAQEMTFHQNGQHVPGKRVN